MVLPVTNVSVAHPFILRAAIATLINAKTVSSTTFLFVLFLLFGHSKAIAPHFSRINGKEQLHRVASDE
jgi:hypothetical protein